MCGIVGVVVKTQIGFINKTENSFYQMLYADALRGEDSTGLIGVERDSTFHIAKDASSADYFAWKFFSEQKKVKADMYSRGRAYIGHNRKRTQGEVTDVNAHPFVVDKDFAMVHNGTLYNHHNLAKGCDVDSEALAIFLRHAIRKAGDNMGKLKEELNNCLGEVNGAYAVAIYDQVTHRVYLLRNKERPLCLIETDDAYYFMSEALMGGWILQRNGYEYSKLKAEALKEHELCVFDLDTIGTVKLHREQLVPKKAKASSKSGNSWGQQETHGTGMTLLASSVIAANQPAKGKPMEGGKPLKKFRDQYLGKRVAFWAEDYLEKHIGRTVDGDGESEVTLMGGLDEVDWWHTIIAEVNLHQLGLRWAEDIGRNKWSGVVGAISVTKSGVIQLYVENAKPMLETKGVLHLLSEAKKKGQEGALEKSKAFRTELGRMLTPDLDVLYEENKHTWAAWQLSAANGERAFRAGVNDILHAARLCREMENGFGLRQVEKQGRLVYVGNEGRIYYESAITVH